MRPIQLALPVVGAPSREQVARWTVDRPLARIPCGPLELRLAADQATAEVELRCHRCHAVRAEERTAWSWSTPLWYTTTADSMTPPFAGELVERVVDCARTDPHGCGDTPWLHDLSARFERVMERLRRRVEADAALAVLPFHERAQATVYWATVLDRRGYVAQLVAQHPGLALVSAHAEPWRGTATLSGDELWGRAWRAVARGRPLAEVTAGAAESLALDSDVGRRLAWLARHVPPNADPELVVDASRCTDAPQSDLPSHAHHRLEWMRAITAVRLAIGIDRAHERWARAAIRYASRHHAAFVRLPPAALHRFVEWLARTERRIARDVPPETAFLDNEEWWEQWAAVRSAEHLLAHLRARGVDAFPEPPLPGWEDRGIRIEPIRTPEELYLEGRHMGHCIFSYCDSVLARTCAVYRVTVDDEPTTLMLDRREGRWTAGEHAGRYNRRPTEMERGAVRLWLAQRHRKGDA